MHIAYTAFAISPLGRLKYTKKTARAASLKHKEIRYSREKPNAPMINPPDIAMADPPKPKAAACAPDMSERCSGLTRIWLKDSEAGPEIEPKTTINIYPAAATTQFEASASRRIPAAEAAIPIRIMLTWLGGLTTYKQSLYNTL